jgi:16S rRNA (adenine1518-N6/adenine1519-N6)-dimethyltransferase
MQSLSEIRQLLESHSLSPRHALGQNFLIDHNLIRKLVDAAGVGAGDVVLEVGPGTGALTEELLARGCCVVAVEIDRGLAGLLGERFEAASGKSHAGAGQGAGTLTLINTDALAGKRTLAPDVAQAIGGRPFKLVANLPYAAATPIISTILLDHPRCAGLYVTIQKEVAERILARPGTKDYGPLSIVAQLMGEPRMIATLPLECFWPRPKVTSAMVGLVRRESIAVDDPRRFADFCQKLFEQRRKQLGAVLGRNRPFPQGIDPAARAEALSIQQLIELFRSQPES